MSLLSKIPGALGLLLRQKLFYKKCGSGVTYGVDVKIYNRANVSVGAGSIIDDGVILDGGNGAGLVIGEGCYIGRETILKAGEGGIFLGNRANFSTWCAIHGENKIEIGSASLFGPDVEIFSGGGDVSVGSSCWVGAHVDIKGEVKMGEHVVIGAGSFVTQDIEPAVVAVGNPAKATRKIG